MVSIGPEDHDDHPARDPRALAPCRLPPLLAMEIPLVLAQNSKSPKIIEILAAGLAVIPNDALWDKAHRYCQAKANRVPPMKARITMMIRRCVNSARCWSSVIAKLQAKIAEQLKTATSPPPAEQK